MKICLACQHFFFDSGHPAYSDVTPGMACDIQCLKGHWRGGESENAADLIDYVVRANNCPDYELSELGKAKGFEGP